MRAVQKTREAMRENDYAGDNGWKRRGGEVERERQRVRENKMAM